MREQLIAQVTLGIASGDLSIGERLPSTREVALRCDLHPNTVSAAYQSLVDRRILEFKKGSGFYVAESASERIEGTREFERLIEDFLESAKLLGFVEADVVKYLRRPRNFELTDRFVVIESDEALREILVHEISGRFPKTRGISFQHYSAGRIPEGAALVAMLDEKSKIEPLLTVGQRCIYLKGRSVSASMSGQTRPSPDETIGVFSGWEGFLSFARIMLLAAKVDPGSLIVRSTADDGWQDATKRASIIICDTVTASRLDGSDRVRQFQIISDESLDELAGAAT